jgi:hypothetical protein|tara:strand:+ start:669 stop:983 length:315 start_codon:yes stop_codon:yes gene_type:complete
MNTNKKLPSNYHKPTDGKTSLQVRAIYYSLKKQKILILKIEDEAPLYAIYCFKTDKAFVAADFDIFLDYRNTKKNGENTRITLKFLQEELQMFTLMQAVRLLKI